MKKGVRPYVRGVQRRLCLAFGRKSLGVGRAGGVISFTFDDFPRSACEIGARILEAHGARGTYFTAMGLAGSDGSHFSVDDVAKLVEHGHEIGCHTYGHVSCAAVGTADLVSQIKRNAKEVSGAAGNYDMVSFAYPWGEVSFSARRTLMNHFACCRGVSPGINVGRVDPSLLRANGIFSQHWNENSIRELIARNERLGGWLIFFTHEITDRPSASGCTPSQLDTVVRAAASSKSEVLLVRDAIASYTQKM